MKERKTREEEKKQGKNKKKKCKKRARTVESLAVIDFLTRWQYLPVYFQKWFSYPGKAEWMMCRLEGKERQARIACGTYIYSRKDGTTRQKEKKMTTTTRQNFRKRKVHIFSSVFSFFQRCSTSTRGYWATSQYYQSASLCPLAFRLADTDVTMLKNIETSMHRALAYRLHLTPQNKSYFVDHHLQRQYAAVQIHLSLSDKQMTSMLLVMIRRKPSSGIAFREKSNRPRCIQATQRKRRQLSSHEQTNANERWFPKDRYFVVELEDCRPDIWSEFCLPRQAKESPRDKWSVFDYELTFRSRTDGYSNWRAATDRKSVV